TYANAAPAASRWRADAYKLIDSQIQLFDIAGSNCTTTLVGTFTHTLFVSGLSSNNYCYTATYTFVAIGATTAPTSVSPVNYISSGMQIKHTDTGDLATLAPLTLTTNHTLVASKTASPTTFI